MLFDLSPQELEILDGEWMHLWAQNMQSMRIEDMQIVTLKNQKVAGSRSLQNIFIAETMCLKGVQIADVLSLQILKMRITTGMS